MNTFAINAGGFVFVFVFVQSISVDVDIPNIAFVAGCTYAMRFLKERGICGIRFKIDP